MKTDLELRHLRVFVTVVEEGAHARAARALGISQSTVSETLSALERAVGTPLFRNVKGPALTPSGEALLPYARRMLAMASELVTELAKVSTQVSGTFVVAAVESICAYVLPSHLAKVRESWPKVRMEVISGVCADIREGVATGKSDLGLVLEAEGGVDDGSVLTRARLLILGSPAHPLVRRTARTASPEELRRCDFCMSDAAGNYHQVLRQYFEGAGTPLPRMQALGTVEGVKRGILAGGTALGLLPAHAVERELRDGVLAEVIVSPALPGLVLRAVRSPGSGISPVVEALLESLRGVSLGAGPGVQPKAPRARARSPFG